MHKRQIVRALATAGAMALGLAAAPSSAWAADKQPNIVVIMGDDIGMWNIGAYHRGMMAGRTPNLDQIAKQGMTVHRLLRRGQLYGGPRQFHYRRCCRSAPA